MSSRSDKNPSSHTESGTTDRSDSEAGTDQSSTTNRLLAQRLQHQQGQRSRSARRLGHSGPTSAARRGRSPQIPARPPPRQIRDLATSPSFTGAANVSTNDAGSSFASRQMSRPEGSVNERSEDERLMIELCEKGAEFIHLCMEQRQRQAQEPMDRMNESTAIQIGPARGGTLASQSLNQGNSSYIRNRDVASRPNGQSQLEARASELGGHVRRESDPNAEANRWYLERRERLNEHTRRSEDLHRHVALNEIPAQNAAEVLPHTSGRGPSLHPRYLATGSLSAGYPNANTTHTGFPNAGGSFMGTTPSVNQITIPREDTQQLLLQNNGRVRELLQLLRDGQAPVSIQRGSGGISALQTASRTPSGGAGDRSTLLLELETQMSRRLQSLLNRMQRMQENEERREPSGIETAGAQREQEHAENMRQLETVQALLATLRNLSVYHAQAQTSVNQVRSNVGSAMSEQQSFEMSRQGDNNRVVGSNAIGTRTGLQRMGNPSRSLDQPP